MLGYSLVCDATQGKPPKREWRLRAMNPQTLIQKNSTFSRYFPCVAHFSNPKSNLRQSAVRSPQVSSLKPLPSVVPPPASSRRAFSLGESPREILRSQASGLSPPKSFAHLRSLADKQKCRP